MMKIYSYIMTDDTGFAPNPFWGICTLACCKPVIRRKALVPNVCEETYVVGIRGKNLFDKFNKITKNKKSIEADDVHKIIYIMKVDKKLPFHDYFQQYEKKKPNKKDGICECGDNIYKPLKNSPKTLEDFEQLESKYHEKKDKEHDLGSNLENNWVILAKEFYYYGREPWDMKDLKFLIPGNRGHRVNFSKEQLDKFDKLFNAIRKTGKKGLINKPHMWEENDTSWKKGCCS